MGHQESQRGDRRSFRDLAELANAPRVVKRASISEIRQKTTATDSDSGMIDLAALADAERGNVDRASVTPLASTELADSEEVPTAPRLSPVPVAVARMTPSTSFVPYPVTMGTPAARVASAQAALKSGANESRGTFGRVAALVGLAAIAAGAFIAVHALRPTHAAVATTGAVQAPAVQTPAVPGAPVVPAAAAAQAPVAAADHGVDPMSLPHAGAGLATIATHHSHSHGHAKGAAADTSAPDDTDAPAPSPVAAKAEAKAAPAAAPPPGIPAGLANALGDAMKNAAAPAAPVADAPISQVMGAPTPASAPIAAGSVPQHPSQGAVTSALSGVLSSARKCIAPDDGPSRAHVVFGSDGTVQSTTITGPAAGAPAEGCIKDALSKAHVPAFAEATYGATVTVRP